MLPTTNGFSLSEDIEFIRLPSLTPRMRDAGNTYGLDSEGNAYTVVNGGQPPDVAFLPRIDGETPATVDALPALDGGAPGDIARMNVQRAMGNYDSILSGMADGIDAVKQAIFLILSTERYKYVIYSHNYGVELDTLYGKPMTYVLPELRRRIREALAQDDRITDVDNFSFETGRSTVTARFTARTIFGDVEAERTVAI